MAYDHVRFREIKSKSTIELIEFMIVRAITVATDRSSAIIDSDAGSIFDNEFIWAKEELEERIKKLEVPKEATNE